MRYAREQVDHCGLAGPVRTDDAQRLPLAEGDAEVVDHFHAAIGLGEVLGLEYDRHQTVRSE